MVKLNHHHYHTQPNTRLRGKVQVPGDKSVSHRVMMLAAIAAGDTFIKGFLASEDCRATLAALKAMGVRVSEHSDTELTIHGVGKHGLQRPQHTLDLGNSGTAIRLLAGLLAGQPFSTTLTGDASLIKRPMMRIVTPLQQMGADIIAANLGRPPLTIHGKSSLHAIEYLLPIASAQVKTCLLLAGLYAEGTTIIHESGISRDHSERMLKTLGVAIEAFGNTIKMRGQQTLTATDITVPGDISSAAFFMVGASIAAGSELLLTNVGVNPTRTGIIDILLAMGANIKIQNCRELSGEPVADILVRSAKLYATHINKACVAKAIDELPIAFIAAALAKGTTMISGAEELRVKESDRLHVMAQGLRALGVELEEKPDGMMIKGGSLQGGHVASHDDHRVAMAFAMAGLCAHGTITITNCANVAASFPNFVSLARRAGLKITVQPAYV